MSLNKRDMLTQLAHTCEKLNIPRSIVHISHGGASLLHGLRETTEDIDVEIMNEVVWERLTRSHKVTRYEALGLNCGASIINVGNIDFHWSDEKDLSTQMYAYREFFVSTKYQLLADRIKLGRSKDMGDIHKLSDFYLQLPKYLKLRLDSLLETASSN